MSKEAMKLALEALECSKGYVGCESWSPSMLRDVEESIKALEEALKQQQCDCKDPSQCWEPCGQLGKSEEHAKVYEQEQGEYVAATDIQISLEAHAEDPEDWNDLNFKECWHKGFSDGFRAAETFHKIGVAK